jgi:hypothetical protein
MKKLYPSAQNLMHNRPTVLTGTRIMSRMFVGDGGAGWRTSGAFVGDEPHIRASENRLHGALWGRRVGARTSAGRVASQSTPIFENEQDHTPCFPLQLPDAKAGVVPQKAACLVSPSCRHRLNRRATPRPMPELEFVMHQLAFGHDNFEQ